MAIRTIHIMRGFKLTSSCRYNRAGEGRGIEINLWIIRKISKTIEIASRGIVAKAEVIIQVTSYRFIIEAMIYET